MLGNAQFYNRTIRKVVVAFGSLFNDIILQRYTLDGATKKEVFRVPLSYGSKEKYLTRITSDPNLTKSIATVVPRISFELIGLGYDSSRKQASTLQNFSYNTTDGLKTQYAPIPYNFDFTLSIYVRNHEDGTQILGGVVASIPFDVIEKLDNGGTRIATEHPNYKIVSREPCELYTSHTFYKTMVLHYLAHGAFYAVINRNSLTNRVNNLHILNPTKMEIGYNSRNELIFKNKETNKTYKGDNILYIPNLAWDGVKALLVPDVHRDNFGLALANRNYGANFYKNGAHLNGVLKHPGRLTNEAYDRLKSSFNRAFGGSQNAGGTAILEEGMDFQKVGLNPTDAAFNETKKATISDIARITGVPGILLEDMDKATFGNMEQLSQMFVNYTIMPLCETIEAEFNRKLFFEAEKYQYCTRFNLDGKHSS